MTGDDDDRIVVGRITITRTLGPPLDPLDPSTADLITVETEDGCGEPLAIVEAVGLLGIAYRDIALNPQEDETA